MMDAKKCKWFVCVYATKVCVINGWLDNGEKNECPHWHMQCTRVKCKYCIRENENGMCLAESEGE